MRRLLITLAALTVLAVGAALYVLFQLTILNPPVAQPSFFDARKAKAYVESTIIPGIDTYERTAMAGGGEVFHAGRVGRPVLLIPDLGAGAWAFAPYLKTLGGSNRLDALDFGVLAPATTLDDLTATARRALTDLHARTAEKIFLVGEGAGSLVALKLLDEAPEYIAGVALLSPYTPRERSDQQQWLSDVIGDFIYRPVMASRQSMSNYWAKNFSSALVQPRLAAKYASLSAQRPFATLPLVREVTYGRLAWLPGAYTRLKVLGLPVLHLFARYDTLNPIDSQKALADDLTASLGGRYSRGLFNSGRMLSLDWRWRETSVVLGEWLRTGALSAPYEDAETLLEPGVKPASY